MSHLRVEEAEMNQSVDPEFAARVVEYQKKAKKGVAFQANGTIGGKRMRPRRALWRARPIRALFRIAFYMMIIKAVLFHIALVIGFDARTITTSQNATFLQPVMKVVLYPDPVSVKASQYMKIGQLYLANALRQIL
jgi:hypothetical protein